MQPDKFFLSMFKNVLPPSSGQKSKVRVGKKKILGDGGSGPRMDPMGRVKGRKSILCLKG
jgi:hypothetical protein